VRERKRRGKGIRLTKVREGDLWDRNTGWLDDKDSATGKVHSKGALEKKK